MINLIKNVSSVYSQEGKSRPILCKHLAITVVIAGIVGSLIAFGLFKIGMGLPGSIGCGALLGVAAGPVAFMGQAAVTHYLESKKRKEDQKVAAEEVTPSENKEISPSEILPLEQEALFPLTDLHLDIFYRLIDFMSFEDIRNLSLTSSTANGICRGVVIRKAEHYGCEVDMFNSSLRYLYALDIEFSSLKTGYLVSSDMDSFTAKEIVAIYHNLAERGQETTCSKVTNYLLKRARNGLIEKSKNFAGDEGGKALMNATQNQATNVVELLLLAGIDPNVLVKTDLAYHSAPLHWAAAAGFSEITQLLLDYGANVNIKSSTGCPPLPFAVGACFFVLENKQLHSLKTEEKALEISQLLLEHGADTHIETPLTYSILAYPAEEGFNRLIKLLLDWGVQIDSTNYEGHTALYRAMKFKKRETVRLLVEDYGAKLSLTDLLKLMDGQR